MASSSSVPTVPPVPLTLPEFGALLGVKDTSGLKWYEVLFMMNPDRLPGRIFPRLLATVTIPQLGHGPKPGTLPPYELGEMVEKFDEKMLKGFTRALKKEAPKSITEYRALLEGLHHESCKTLQGLYFAKAFALARTEDDYENLWFATTVELQRNRILEKVNALESLDAIWTGMLFNYARDFAFRRFADELFYRVAVRSFVKHFDEWLRVYEAADRWKQIRLVIEERFRRQFPTKESDWKNEEIVEKAVALFVRCITSTSQESPLRSMADKFLSDILEGEETVFNVTLSSKAMERIRYAERQLCGQIHSSTRTLTQKEHGDVYRLRMKCLKRIAKAVNSRETAVSYLRSIELAPETKSFLPEAYALVKKYST